MGVEWPTETNSMVLSGLFHFGIFFLIGVCLFFVLFCGEREHKHEIEWVGKWGGS